MLRQASAETKRANAKYFADNMRVYREKVQTLDTYKNIRRAVNGALGGIGELIDIGNGGVFAYDTSALERIVAVDVCFHNLTDDLIAKYFPPNATAKEGDALAIPAGDGSFDGALMDMLVHHLVGRTLAESRALALTALSEAQRVVRPGGRIIVVESCVPTWVYFVERFLFALVAPIVRKFSSHPPTLQYTVHELEIMLRSLGSVSSIQRIEKGKWVIIYGFTLPALLVPVTPYIFVHYCPVNDSLASGN